MEVRDEADAGDEAVRTLRKCHKWAGLLTTGTYHEKKALADALGLSNSYLGKMLRLAYLSPRIVEAIMPGELPSISVTKLQELDTPIWEEQASDLGAGTKSSRELDTPIWEEQERMLGMRR